MIIDRQIIQTKDPDGATCWRIVLDGREHPAYFYSKLDALSWLGLLSGQGFGKRKTEAA